MENKQPIIMPVRAKHFKDSNFSNPCNCAISKAAQEFFNVNKYDANEGVTQLHIGRGGSMHSYHHKEYGDRQYYNNAYKASMHNYDETIIFELELIKA